MPPFARPGASRISLLWRLTCFLVGRFFPRRFELQDVSQQKLQAIKRLVYPRIVDEASPVRKSFLVQVKTQKIIFRISGDCFSHFHYIVRNGWLEYKDPSPPIIAMILDPKSILIETLVPWEPCEKWNIAAKISRCIGVSKSGSLGKGISFFGWLSRMPKGLAAEKLIVERSSFGTTFPCFFASCVDFQQGFAMKVPFLVGVWKIT